MKLKYPTPAEVVCPFDPSKDAKAKGRFLDNPFWQRIYGAAPDGARRRLACSFYFTTFKDEPDFDLDSYRDYRSQLEDALTEEDLEYLIGNNSNANAQRHFGELLETLRQRKTPSSKFMTYRDFFARVEEEGEFTCFDYEDEVRAEIFLDVPKACLKVNDVLVPALADILSSGVLREVRVYPKNECMLVRIETKFLDKAGTWGKPYQMLVFLDCFNELLGYTFVRGTERVEVHPEELQGEETEVQRARRLELESQLPEVLDMSHPTWVEHVVRFHLDNSSCGE